MAANLLDSFCGSKFWDPAISWETPDPDFTPCMEKTVLVWIPCLFLWLLSPVDWYYIHYSKAKTIPWGFLNVTKLTLTVALIILIAADYLYNIVLSVSGEVVYGVDLWMPALKMISYGYSCLLLIWNKAHGLRTSSVLFIFWLVMVVTGAPRFRTEIRKEVKGELDESLFHFVTYVVSYPITIVLFILNFFADAEPTFTEHPKVQVSDFYTRRWTIKYVRNRGSVLILVNHLTGEKQRTCPELSASFFSRVVFLWFDKMAWNGYRRDLKPEDMWNMRPQDSSAEVIPQFDKHWMKTLHNSSKSKINNYGTISTPAVKRKKTAVVTWALWKAFGHTFLFGAVMKLLGDLCAFIQPQILRLLIKFVSGKEYMWRGYMYVVLLLVVAEVQTFFNTHYIMTMSEVGLRVRTSLISAIYRKALLMSNSAHKESTVGEIVNLMAVDAQRFIELTAYMNMIWAAPLTIGLAFYFLWQFLGPSSAAGLIVMLILIPLNMYIANRIKLLQIKQMRYKDERVKLMNEILCGIKVLKLYAWEPSFEEQILAIRNKEVRVLRKAALLNASTAFIWTCTPLLVSLMTFGVYVLSDKRNVIDSQTAFVSISLINIMRTPIAQLPMLISVLVQAGVSLKRINNFMNTEELDPTSVSHDETQDDPLIMENGVFTWDGAQKGTIILRSISMRIKEGALVAIVGTVGSGKSSLINAFLGEMDKVSGYVNVKLYGRFNYIETSSGIASFIFMTDEQHLRKINSYNRPIKGKKSYVPQQAWIQNATLKDNILFGLPMVEKKYREVVKACALESDFKMLPSGDMTEIGEKGINLSGGQKQRVSLARSVYNEADIYLLDDPLSAVDSHVGKHIFENVIGPKGVLRKKTRVLVTHSVTFLPEVDYIYVLRGGEIIECGTYKELLAEKGEFADFLVQHLTEIDDPDQETDIEDMLAADPDLKAKYRRTLSHLSSRMSTRSLLGRKDSVNSRNSSRLNKQQSVDQLIQVEQSETGSVKWTIYYHYLKYIGWLLVIGTVLFNVLAQACQIGSNIWLSVWSSDKTTVVNGLQDVGKRNLYIGVYALFGSGQLLCSILCSFALAIGTLLAAKWLHLKMLSNIFHAPMSFFDTTPTGRVVNRFSKDIDVVDNTLPNNISAFLNCFFQVIGTLIVVAYSTPLFLAIIIPVGILYYFIQRFYVSTSRQLKRLESVSRSPIYSHFSESVTGAASIRAYGVQDRFIKGSSNRVDNNQTFLYPSMVSNRWLGTRLETVGNLVIFFAALFSVIDRDNLDPGVVGLSVSYALQVTSILNYCVRMTSEVETNIVAVERIQEYANIPQEAPWWLKPAPEPTWPHQGRVEFKDYQVRYRQGLELVLKGISFVVNGGEKIGIVGRTGAGKSSLTLCLFRIIESAGGSINIDGLDISTLGLNDLRSKLTIIPQDPILFSGTLRINLDPFKKCKDEEIWRALDLSHLSYFARNLPNGLDHQISEGGENLSVGQRQLMCLARALLRKTKVLVLDEATAAVDLETDDLIQRTIRSEFKGCTVLTIAHRLNTILDSDRVIVLDKGYLKEFDPPSVLLKKKTSIFYGMARDAGLI